MHDLHSSHEDGLMNSSKERKNEGFIAKVDGKNSRYREEGPW
jgi:hypothetical protein